MPVCLQSCRGYGTTNDEKVECFFYYFSCPLNCLPDKSEPCLFQNDSWSFSTWQITSINCSPIRMITLTLFKSQSQLYKNKNTDTPTHTRERARLKTKQYSNDNPSNSWPSSIFVMTLQYFLKCRIN